MSDAWLAITWIAVFLVLGGTISVTVMARARKYSAIALQAERYRELAEKAANAQKLLSEELASLNDRVAKIEELLRDVG